MRYAILSDVHANLEALRAVLAQLDGEAIDELLCLGDLVGYHADPNDCIALLRERGALCIAGNHDRAAVGRGDTRYFGEAARRAIEWTRRELTPESARYLGELPLTLRRGGLLLVHGALHPAPSADLHLTSVTRAAYSLDALCGGAYAERVCLFGHTHRAAVYERRGREALRRRERQLALDPAGAYLINPGSVGQPRDGDPRAAYALIDVDAAGRRTLRLRRVAYDEASCRRKAAAAGLLHEEGALRRSRHWLREQLQDGKERLRRRLGR